MKDKSESYEAELNNGSQQPVTDEVVNAVASTKSIMHYLRASTWPMSAPNRTRKARQLVNFLNLHREDENVSIFSDTDQNPQAPGSPGSLLSRATQLALEHLDLGSSAPGHLSKVLNKQATAGFSTTGKFLHTMSENSRLTSPPPSDLSSVSSDEPSTAAARASAPLSGILCSSSSSSHAFNRRRRRRNTNNDDSTAVNVDEEEEEEEDQDESGCFTAATTATTSSSTNQGQKSPSSSMSTPNHQQSHHNHRHHHHHQVRIIDNRLKKPADEAALLHARRRLPHRFTRSCTSNDDDEDDNEEEGDNSVAALQKHVILLSRDAETMTPLQTATRRHSSFVSPAAASASPSASASCTTLSGALKRCNTTSSVYEPGKSTLKRERAKQQRQPQPQNQNFTSSDEVETDYGGGGGGVVFGGGGGGLSVATNMEPICVVNLATPISRNISFESSGQPQQPQQLDPQPQQRVNLLVEGVRFVIDVERLRAHPDTMLGRMFSADSRFLENTHLTTTATPSGGTTTTTTTTCEDEDENEEEVVDGDEEEDSGSSSVCSGRAMDDVEQWMAVASTSTALVSTHSAPASYRSHRGSVCGRRRRRRRKGDAAASSRHHRKQQRKRHSQGTNTAAVAAVETGSDVCLTGSGVPANVFRVLLDFYLKGKMVCTPDISVRQLKQACEYFLIPFNHETVSCSNLREFLHEVSNDGAHAIFEEFLEVAVVPQFMECARQGERECHIVILTDDEHVHWDDQYPPQMPEAELSSHIIYSTRMYRFLKYIENREIAKQVLTERGLKKIRIGIEGYPTCKERMKFRVGSRPEAIYNYVQRPFLRMSWEQEENKSRHVDFQCVKSKSVSDLASLDQAVIDRPPSLTASAAAAASPTGAPAAIDPVPPRYSPSLPHPHHTGNQ